MAIDFDAESFETTSGGTGGNLSWTHTPVAAPRGATIGVVQDAGGVGEIASVTYGGDAVPAVPSATVDHVTGSEDGAIYFYHLGTSIPTGPQLVEVIVSGGSLKAAACCTVTAATDTEVDTGATLDSGGVANPSLVLGTTAATNTFIMAGLHSGQNAPSGVAPGADYTQIHEDDFGSRIMSFVRRTAIATGGNITVDWIAASEEAGIGAVAIRELTGGGGVLVTDATESFAFSDSMVRQADAFRQINEPFAFSDTILLATTFASLLVVEMLGLADIFQRRVTWSQALSDDFSYDETFDRRADALLALLDNIGVEDSARATNAIVLFVSEFIGLVETFDRQADAFRAISENLGGADTAARQVDVFRVFSDDWAYVDTYGRWLSIVIEELFSLDDNDLSIDAIQFAISYAIMASDSVAYTPSLIDRILTATRMIADILGVVDSPGIATNYNRAFTDEIEVLEDDLRRTVEFRRLILEGGGYSETFDRRADALRAIQENIGLAQLFARRADAFRTVEESFGVTESLRLIVRHLRAFLDAIGIADAAAVATRFKIAMIEAFGLTTDATAFLIVRRAISEFIGLADAVQRNADANRSISDVIGQTDIVQRIVQSLRSFSDNLGLADALGLLTLSKRSVSENVGGVDSADRQLDYKRAVTENIHADDEVQRIADAFRSISNSLGLSDSTAFILHEAAVIIWDAIVRPLTWTAKRVAGDYTMSVMATEVPEKQPGELRTARFEFDDLLASGETLASAPTVTVIPSGLTIAGVTIIDTRLECSVAGGVDGQRYHLEATCVTSLGQTVQCDGWLIVKGE